MRLPPGAADAFAAPIALDGQKDAPAAGRAQFDAFKWAAAYGLMLRGVTVVETEWGAAAAAPDGAPLPSEALIAHQAAYWARTSPHAGAFARGYPRQSEVGLDEDSDFPLFERFAQTVTEAVSDAL